MSFFLFFLSLFFSFFFFFFSFFLAATYTQTGVEARASAAANEAAAAAADMDEASVRTDATSRSTLLDVISGVGQRDPTAVAPLPKPDTSKPYLVLDLRDPEDYTKCHIAEGKRLWT